MTKDQWNARKGRTSSWIRREKRLAIYLRDGVQCAYCGTDLRDARPHEMGLDHLEPQDVCRGRGNKTRAGKSVHHESNLVTACRTCNSSRKHTPWRKFATGGAIRRIERQRRRKLNMDLARAVLRGDADWSDL